MIQQTVSANIIYYRTLHKYSRVKLGKMLGMGHQGIMNWENGNTWPPPNRIDELAKIFNIDPSLLYLNPIDQQLLVAIKGLTESIKESIL